MGHHSDLELTVELDIDAVLFRLAAVVSDAFAHEGQQSVHSEGFTDGFHVFRSLELFRGGGSHDDQDHFDCHLEDLDSYAHIGIQMLDNGGGGNAADQHECPKDDEGATAIALLLVLAS